MNGVSTEHGPAQTILIVDDAQENLALLVDCLEARGLRALIAQDGIEGVQRASHVRPDLILLDVVMPGMDGFATCRELKANAATRDIPVIFMTALEQTRDKVAAFESGGVDCVTKPIQIEEVLARIETHLALRSMQAALAAHNTRLQQEIAVRQRAEAALQQAHDLLERRVAERTAELQQTNRDILAEISERVRAESALREREGRLRRLIDSNIIGIFFWGPSGVISDANDEFLRIAGCTRVQLMREKIRWTDITPPQWYAADEQGSRELEEHGSCTPYEKEYVRRDGRRMPVLVGGARLDGPGEQGVAFVLDLSERKQAEERVRYLAHHDALTGLLNRALLQDRINQAVAQAHRSGEQQVAVLFIDLDHFKHVNDSLGHEAGDRLLQIVAGRLQRCLREGDSVARLGGDEFVISLPALADGQDAADVAQKVLTALRRDISIDGYPLHVTVSIGISIYPADGEDAPSLMRAADIAMYHAKERGRNSYQFFSPCLNEVARRRLELVNRLHDARAHGELLLHFQPQIELQNGAVASVEALLRWQRADGRLMSCAEFIAIAEETGQILPIGEWALREACRQLHAWHLAGRPDLRVAVNISPRQLRQPGFHELVQRILAEHDLDGSALEIEITESVLMLQTPETLATLDTLVALGVQFAVDDFGMGYSSLAYLRRFPVSTLKIDRSFMSGVGQNPNDAAIVTAIIAMAQSLRLRIVAEGVECDEQVRFLRGAGCQAVQGYLFGVPVSAEEMTARLFRDGPRKAEASAPSTDACAATQRARGDARRAPDISVGRHKASG